MKVRSSALIADKPRFHLQKPGSYVASRKICADLVGMRFGNSHTMTRVNALSLRPMETFVGVEEIVMATGKA